MGSLVENALFKRWLSCLVPGPVCVRASARQPSLLLLTFLFLLDGAFYDPLVRLARLNIALGFLSMFSKYESKLYVMIVTFRPSRILSITYCTATGRAWGRCNPARPYMSRVGAAAAGGTQGVPTDIPARFDGAFLCPHRGGDWRHHPMIKQSIPTTAAEKHTRE